MSCSGVSFDEGLLFTHRGLSGPAILQISSYWREGDEVVIDLARGKDVFAELRRERVARPKLQLDNAWSALVAARAVGADQSALLVEMQGGHGDAAALRHFADRQFLLHHYRLTSS